MWAEHEKYRNHFLQMHLKHLNPAQINLMTQKEFSKTHSSHVLNRVKISCKSALYFENHADLAYGFGALDKLMHELACDDYLTQWRAINTLSEYIMNPLHAQTAIKQYDIVRRCQNVFLRIRLNYHKVKFREISRLLNIFYHICLYRNGVEQILERYRLLDQFYDIIKERKEHLQAISKILPLLTATKENCQKLIENYKVYDKLVNVFQMDPCISYYPSDLWLHVSHIFELAPVLAIEKGFFEILYQRICGKLFQYHIWDIKCLGLLLHCPLGQKRFAEKDVLKMLYEILKQDPLDNYEHVIYCLMQGLFTKSVLWRSREFTDLPLIVIKLAKDDKNPKQQLFCLQTLRELGVMPCVKRFIKANCLEDLRNLSCLTLNNERERQEIVYWLEREIYHKTNLRKD
ncbi:uncharacterized protein ACRADG_009507 [Cochliomyia hominivorax]